MIQFFSQLYRKEEKLTYSQAVIYSEENSRHLIESIKKMNLPLPDVLNQLVLMYLLSINSKETKELYDKIGGFKEEKNRFLQELQAYYRSTLYCGCFFGDNRARQLVSSVNGAQNARALIEIVNEERENISIPKKSIFIPQQSYQAIPQDENEEKSSPKTSYAALLETFYEIFHEIAEKENKSENKLSPK